MTDTKLDHLVDLKLQFEAKARKTRSKTDRRQFEKMAATYHAMAMTEMKKAAAEAATP
jgi:hypothetical protein